MTTMKQLKVKVLRAQQKNGVPLFIQKRREQFGTFNKVKKLRKVVRFTLPPVTPLRRFQKVVKVVMANNKTKKWREETRVINVKLPEKIQQIVMTEQRFPKFPSVRKGREGESLSTQEKNELSERIKLINTDWNYNVTTAEGIDLDLDNDENGEYDFDEWKEDEVDLDIDDVNYE